MRRPLLAAAVAIACASTSGCFAVTVQTDTMLPVVLNKPQAGGHYFQEEERLHYLWFGLFPLNPGVPTDMLRRYQTHGLRSVTVTTHMDGWSWLALGLTYGVYTNRVVKLEGASD